MIQSTGFKPLISTKQACALAFVLTLIFSIDDGFAQGQDSSAAQAEASIIEVFNGTSRGTFKPFVGDESRWDVPAQGVPVSTYLGELEVQSIAYQNEADSRQLVWSGDGSRPSQFYWQSTSPTDLTSMSERGGALAILARVDQSPEGKVTWRMDCGYPCGGDLDMTPILQNIPEGQWFMVGVELSCFEDAGANLVNVQGPLVVISNHAFGFSFHQVAIVENLPEQQLIPCG